MRSPPDDTILSTPNTTQQLHKIVLYAYLRGLFFLLPGWSVRQVLELARLNWAETSARPEVVKVLKANVYRRASLGSIVPSRQQSVSWRAQALPVSAQRWER